MDQVKNCKICHRIIQENGLHEVCPSCRSQDEADFDLIRQYLYQHPYAKILEVATALNMSISRIKRYLREGRLEIVEENNLFLDCEACGRPIHTGKYCDDCLKQSSHEYKSLYCGKSSPSKESGIKFRQYSRNETVKGKKAAVR